VSLIVDFQKSITDLSQCLQCDCCRKPQVPANDQFQIQGQSCQSQSGGSETSKSWIEQTCLQSAYQVSHVLRDWHLHFVEDLRTAGQQQCVKL